MSCGASPTIDIAIGAKRALRVVDVIEFGPRGIVVISVQYRQSIVAT